MSAAHPVAELVGGPKDGDLVELPAHIPARLTFAAATGGGLWQYRFVTQDGDRRLRYEWAGREA